MSGHSFHTAFGACLGSLLQIVRRPRRMLHREEELPDDGARMFGETMYDDAEGLESPNAGGGGLDVPWKPGKELLKRRAKLAKNIQQVRPHEVTQEMADGACAASAAARLLPCLLASVVSVASASFCTRIAVVLVLSLLLRFCFFRCCCRCVAAWLLAG